MMMRLILAAAGVMGVGMMQDGGKAQPGAKPEAGGAQGAAGAARAVKSARDDSASEKLGWKLGVQAWTFRDRTAFEAVETAQRLGLKYIEFYPGQALSKEKAGEKVGPELSKESRDELKKKLADCGVKAMNFGVVGFKKDEAEAKKVFEFAKEMGIDTITCEPEPDAWDIVENMCYHYNINAAVHDHPKPSRYWSPDIVIEAIKNRGMRVGACADTGHWARSGLNPIECLHKLGGRIITLHFKDISKGEDKPWGTGDEDARGMLKELHDQGFRGVISMEYESGAGAELEANAAKCIAFFDKVAAELVAEDEK